MPDFHVKDIPTTLPPRPEPPPKRVRKVVTPDMVQDAMMLIPSNYVTLGSKCEWIANYLNERITKIPPNRDAVAHLAAIRFLMEATPDQIQEVMKLNSPGR